MVKYCWSCGNPVKPGQKFCGKCGVKLEEDVPIEPPLIPEDDFENLAKDKNENARVENSILSILCLLLVAGCLYLWFCAPLTAINLLTIGDQPSGWTLLASGDYEFEYLKDSTIFWLEIASLGGMLLCLLAIFNRSSGGTRIFAALTEVSLVAAAIQMYRWLEGDMDYFFDAFGYGFWAIAVLMLVVFLLSGGIKRKE